MVFYFKNQLNHQNKKANVRNSCQNQLKMKRVSSKNCRSSYLLVDLPIAIVS